MSVSNTGTNENDFLVMIDLIDISSVSRVADWVELNVVYFQISLSKSKLISILEDNEFEPDDSDSWDEFYDSILQEIDRRIFLYGAGSPIKIAGNVVEPVKNWQDCPEYILCLHFSYWGAENAHQGTKLFERVSNEALKSYLSGKAITLGFPNANSLSDQLDALAEELYEQRGNRNPEPADKDRGVDVIGWIPFDDERNSQIIILMQCAAGRRWDKKKNIPLSTWAQYIHWNFYTTVPSISVTEVIDDKRWQNKVGDYGIIFDRARIYKNIYKPTFVIDTTLRTEILGWCTNNLN